MSDHEYHAKLSPSGASRWLACPGSVVLSEGIKDSDSAYSAEGTAAHTIAAWCLKDKVPADQFIGETLNVGAYKIPITKEMARYVQSYADYVLECAEGKMLFVEVAVPIGHLTGEQGATGTADAIIVDTANRDIRVIDLKYGAGVAVYATDNEQMQMYALGSIEECSLISDFDTVTMAIFQPRVRDLPDEWQISTRQLDVFANVVAAGADTVRAAAARRDSGSDAWTEAYLHPGEKQCKFCSVPKHTCPAYLAATTEAMGALSATADDFADFVPDVIDDTTGDNWLTVLFAKTPLIEALCKSVRAEVERRCLKGNGTWGDFKMVRGKQGNRAWSDVDEAEKLLRGFRYKVDDIYDKKLISPTTAEKLLKKANPGHWAKTQELITRPEGKLSVAPISDPRPAESVVATAADFAGLAETAE